MVSKTLLKEYGFSHEHDYYDYIVESHINGNFSQVKELFSKCTQEQKKTCIQWAREMGHEDIVNYLFNLL